jgi:hypothetical protein
VLDRSLPNSLKHTQGLEQLQAARRPTILKLNLYSPWFATMAHNFRLKQTIQGLMLCQVL